jgi:hypothetical protein
LAAFASQRDHLYTNEVGLPVHVPGEAVRRLPRPACPLIVGGALLVGGATVTVRVSHHLRVPRRGSPKTVLLQSTPPVNVLGAVKVPFAP